MASTHINVSDAYLDCLAKHVPDAVVPKEIDVVVGAGGITSLRSLGALSYVSALVRARKTKVMRVSAASAGSIAALAFLFANEVTFDGHSALSALLTSIHVHGDLRHFFTLLQDRLIGQLDAQQLASLNERLYITFKKPADATTCIISRFETPEALGETVRRSCQIPYLSDGSVLKDGLYCDGLTPMLFTDKKRPILFLSPVEPLRLADVFWASSPSRAWSLEMEGATDAHEFFSQGRSRYCSYLHAGWSVQYAMMCARESLFMMALACLCVLTRYARIMPLLGWSLARVRGLVVLLVRALAR